MTDLRGNPPAGEVRRVTSLVGAGQVEMAIRCLGSLQRAAVEPIRLRLHDDGTLTSGDRERLGAGLAGPEFVSREQGDDLAAPVLRNRPSLRWYRQNHPLAIKLIDVALGAGPVLSYCDTDVLFLRRCSGLFELPAGAGAVFMSDIDNAYSVRSWQLLRERRLTLPRRANTGILLIRAEHYDPDLLEWYLSREEHRFAPVWLEQTAWALLGWRAGCHLIEPTQISIPPPDHQGASTAVALHFVSSVRRLLAQQPPATPADEVPLAIRTAPALRCRASDLAADEARRLFRRWLR